MINTKILSTLDFLATIENKNHNPSAANIEAGIANNIQNLKAKEPTGRLKVRLFMPKNVNKNHPNVINTQVYLSFFNNPELIRINPMTIKTIKR